MFVVDSRVDVKYARCKRRLEILESVFESELTCGGLGSVGKESQQAWARPLAIKVLCSASVPFDEAEVFVTGLKSSKFILWKLAMAGLLILRMGTGGLLPSKGSPQLFEDDEQECIQ
jgi:hypothetical protein